MAKSPRKSTAKPTRRRRGLSVSADRDQEQLVDQLQTANGAIPILRQQVEGCRAAFFRLAQCRAADMVIHQAKSWDDAGAYINAEMKGLDAAIQSVAQNGAAT